jgi:hypothetical protein
MKWLVPFMMVWHLFVPSFVVGQEEDMLGIFFDTEGTLYHAQAMPGEQIAAYIIIKNPSGLDGVYGWMGDLLIEGPAQANVWTPNTVVPCYDCCGWAGWPPFYCSYPAPTPWAPNLVLAEGPVLVLGMEQIRFYVLPVPGEASIVYLTSGGPSPDMRILHPVSGAFDRPVATINGEPPIRDGGKAWGAVKALYR